MCGSFYDNMLTPSVSCVITLTPEGPKTGLHQVYNSERVETWLDVALKLSQLQPNDYHRHLVSDALGHGRLKAS